MMQGGVITSLLIQKAAKECTEWHGCASGDCPHEKYSECFDAVFVEGAKWMLEQWEKENQRLAQMEHGR